jgi:phosphoglycerol transferase
MLLVAVMVLILVTRRDIRGLIQGGIVVGLIVGFLLLSSLPVLMYELENGPNNEAAQREPVESDIYSLRLVQMVFPAPGHQVDAIADFAQNYYYDDGENIPQGEGPHQSLGLIATVGFLWLLLVALAGCLSPRWQIGTLVHRQLAPATVIAFLTGTTSGISLVFAYLVSPQIRAWNRLSIFIAFFAIAAIALLLEALQERIRVRRGGLVLVGIVLSSVLLIGLYDQSSKRATLPSNYSAEKDEYINDAAFVSAIDDELPSQAQVFQLPYVPFPENSGGPNKMRDYDLIKPYLHDNDLRWSSGTVKGRPEAEWQADLADKPTEDLVDTVIAKGFDGVYIDRRGYPDRAAELEGELGDLLKVEPVVDARGDRSFFSLLPYKEDLQGHTSLKSSQG